MTVRDLIDRLEEFDDDAEVLLMTQESWPFENELAGVTSREDLLSGDEDDESTVEGAPSDVFLVEGRQLRYGSKSAWEVI